jgi:18S rRNA (guanine1575-N7)-methyltransferase
VGNGGSSSDSRIEVPEGLTGDGDTIENEQGVKWEGRRRDRSDRGAKGKKRKGLKDRDWILRKKEVWPFQQAFESKD